MSDAYPHVQVESRAELRAWLADNHEEVTGIWLVTFRKAAGERHLSYDDLVEEALCFGWVDSKARALDDERSMLLLTPRKPGSGWSRPNKLRIAKLEEAGLIAPAGRRVLDAAKADGSWTFLDDVEDLIEPPDLVAALDADPQARAEWDAFPRSAKRAILEWIKLAKRDATREKRVRETVERAAQGERANQWPR